MSLTQGVNIVMKYGKMIGIGNTACVYEWEEGKVLKLFNLNYPEASIEKEFHNAMVIADLDFAKPKVYEIISYEDKKGIIYDRVYGESLLDWVMKTGDVHKCASYMSTLHKAILKNKVSNIPNYKDFLKSSITNASLTIDKHNEMLQMINTLADGDALCHGDFHPGNILLSGEEAYIIDFMNICCGNFLYDVARTVYLVEYTPVPENAADRDSLLQFKKALSETYLMQMNVTREMIQDYLGVIVIARKGECPNE